jgi:hypothetical protein
MPPSNLQPKSFTVRYNGRTNKLTTKGLISKAVNPANITPSEVFKTAKEYDCIWDTGATNSVISQKVVDDCALQPTGMAQVHSATEVRTCETFLVSIFLPNGVAVPSIRVTKVDMLTDCDILIGMDIINKGDFAVTHHDGTTTFSFRYPSVEQIDFVKQKPGPVHSTKISRNSQCPCGSGKKYKKCCGKDK